MKIIARYRHPEVAKLPPLPKQNSPTLPRSAGRSQKGLISLYWDLENCAIPRQQLPFDIVQRIRSRFVTPDLREVGFNCYCDAKSISNENRISLSHANVNIVDVPDRKPGGVDRKILLDLDRFERTHNPPATVILISGDIDFVIEQSSVTHVNK
ncbi:unnamed protein product [Didymodactylos carnosus]|uniref:NYN domain-containing protein n=1 Tax=Didymodactylos carnosus TaxID=1234261 RepID=A0A814W8V2_9BILA|nr:unnamed protein product [Didymodactylos carnosus]CAF1195434.1 unnamed protein product [Didymodactylos carnosus]CAF3771823.1 unnamed protein product [Didymodactylos carnosus]CAF3959855.1 unnamed protein product [Didymodactylos carnosus]